MTTQHVALSPSGAADTSSPQLKRRRFGLAGNCCGSVSVDLADVARLPGVADVQVFDAAGLVVVTCVPDLPDTQIVRAAARSGATLQPARSADGQRSPRWWLRPELAALVVAGILLAAGILAEHVSPDLDRWTQALEIAAIVAGGTYPLRAAGQALGRRQMTISVLLVGAAGGAIALGRIEEAAELIVVFSLGEVLEGYAADRARGSIRALMRLSPPEATRVRSVGVTEIVPVEALMPGDVVLVRPGERLPTDGVVSDGYSWIDQGPVTGESMPVEAAAGAEVFGGTINGAGALQVTATKPYADTVLARVIRQVEEAQANRGQAQRFADRFGATYTPLMFAVAAVVAATGPLFGLGVTEAIYRGLVVLSVSCSCALVISVPVTVVAAITRAARNGILIKGGAHLERLAAVDTVAFDKTGTLTEGRPVLRELIPLAAADEEELLQLAASVEQASEHPLARTIVAAAAARRLPPSPADDIRILPGQGVRARVAGRTLRAGRPSHQHLRDPQVSAAVETVERSGATAITLTDLHSDQHGHPPTVLGVLGLVDTLRPGAADTVGVLRRLGVRQQVMLTGDNPSVAAAVAGAAGLDGYRAQLMPEEKTAAVNELRAAGRVVAMVGDGVNDAPALASADVGIAMGAAGTDVALETADLALMADDLTHLPDALRLARRARRIIQQNIVLSLASVAILVVAALAGSLSLTEGIVLNEGTAILIIVNGLRMLRSTPQHPTAPGGGTPGLRPGEVTQRAVAGS